MSTCTFLCLGPRFLELWSIWTIVPGLHRADLDRSTARPLDADSDAVAHHLALPLSRVLIIQRTPPHVYCQQRKTMRIPRLPTYATSYASVSHHPFAPRRQFRLATHHSRSTRIARLYSHFLLYLPLSFLPSDRSARLGTIPVAHVLCAVTPYPGNVLADSNRGRRA